MNKENDTKTSGSSETSRAGTTKTLSGFSGRGIKSSSSEYSRSTSRNDEIVRKRAKPGYLLKRQRYRKKKITKKQRSTSSINKYSSTKVKARNFLSNVSYNRIKNSDYQNRSFVIDCFSFLLLYLNPFYLERKFESTIERDYVNVLWSFMMPETLYNFICRDENFKTLNKLKLKFHQVNEIVRLFIEDESSSLQQQQFDILKDYLIKHAKSYQFIYRNLFPRCFAGIDDYGIQSKTAFNVHYKNYLTQKSIFEWQQKNSLLTSMDSIDENIRANITPLNMTKLNEEEEKKEDIDLKKEMIDDVIILLLLRKMKRKKKKRKKVHEKR